MAGLASDLRGHYQAGNLYSVTLEDVLYWAVDASPHPLIGGPVGEVFWSTVLEVWEQLWPDVESWRA